MHMIFRVTCSAAPDRQASTDYQIADMGASLTDRKKTTTRLAGQTLPFTPCKALTVEGQPPVQGPCMLVDFRCQVQSAGADIWGPPTAGARMLMDSAGFRAGRPREEPRLLVDRELDSVRGGARAQVVHARLQALPPGVEVQAGQLAEVGVAHVHVERLRRARPPPLTAQASPARRHLCGGPQPCESSALSRPRLAPGQARPQGHACCPPPPPRRTAARQQAGKAEGKAGAAGHAHAGLSDSRHACEMLTRLTQAERGGSGAFWHKDALCGRGWGLVDRGSGRKGARGRRGTWDWSMKAPRSAAMSTRSRCLYSHTVLYSAFMSSGRSRPCTRRRCRTCVQFVPPPAVPLQRKGAIPGQLSSLERGGLPGLYNLQLRRREGVLRPGSSIRSSQLLVERVGRHALAALLGVSQMPHASCAGRATQTSAGQEDRLITAPNNRVVQLEARGSGKRPVREGRLPAVQDAGQAAECEGW